MVKERINFANKHVPIQNSFNEGLTIIINNDRLIEGLYAII